MCNFSRKAKLNPSDIIPNEGVELVTPDKVQIDLRAIQIPGLSDLPRCWILKVSSSGSMQPVMFGGHNTLLIQGRNPQDHTAIVDWLFNQEPGNIAVYDRGDMTIHHRVVGKKLDKDGPYLVFKGDHNSRKDPVKVRPGMIEWVSIGTIY